MITLHDIGHLKKVKGYLYDYIGKFDGQTVVAYPDEVGSGRLLLKRVEGNIDEFVREVEERQKEIKNEPKEIQKVTIVTKDTEPSFF